METFNAVVNYGKVQIHQYTGGDERSLVYLWVGYDAIGQRVRLTPEQALAVADALCTAAKACTAAKGDG